MPQFLDTSDPDFERRFAALLGQKREADADVDADVAAILADVAARGDAAVIEMTERWDRLALTPATLAFSAAEIDAAVAAVGPDDRAALELAADAHPRLSRAPASRGRPLDRPAGAELGWRWTPVASAGLYVPGGLASYPSSLLMNAIPARVAGVERLVVCAPTPDGAVNPLVLLAARLAGIDTVYRIGGAQAIAALAFGTETIARGRQDHRPRQRLGRRRQAPGLRAGRHRHDRRPVRGADPRRRRTTTPTGSRSTCSPRPSTTPPPRRS